MPAMLPRIAPEELAALRKGDEDALAHVFASHYYSLASEAEQALGETTGLARVVEGAFVRAWHEREKLETPDEFERFLHGAVHEGAVREKSRRAALHRLETHTVHGTNGHHAHGAEPVPAERAWSEVSAALHAPVTDDAHARRVRKDLSKHAVTDHLAVVAKKRSLKYPILLAIAFVAIAGPTVWWLNGASKHAVATSAIEREDARVVTAPSGQQGVVKLLDGSMVTLMNGSSVRIPKGFGSELRSVRVLGSASVTAPATLATPLDVRAGLASLVGAGTTFDVGAEQERPVVVRVRLGELLVKTVASSRTIGLGQSVAIGADGTVREATPAELREGLAWADGRLVVEGRSLKEVLPMMRRWYGLDIGVADEALFERTVTMDAPLSSSREAIEAIERSARVDFGYDNRSMILRDAAAPKAATKR